MMRDPMEGTGRTGDRAEDAILHGGARRLATRELGAAMPGVQRISWYEIAPGDRCTRHVHQGKTETWLIIAGEGEATAGTLTRAIAPGDLLVTEPGVPHGLINTGILPLRFVNVALRLGNEPVTTRELPEK